MYYVHYLQVRLPKGTGDTMRTKEHQGCREPLACGSRFERFERLMLDDNRVRVYGGSIQTRVRAPGSGTLEHSTVILE